ncbi:FtsJ-domain-containing protein [Rhizoclosmatium globosum]|uniref:Cap-specific mRNA (nucleoside-2'-O-)-methyltransferase 1 n=1 Tax=Rhizoclosmatium globosum TaxID=329046 RepID=A0A1Y2CPU3_9FUNG|nr:FtsJ-domain-containing protein [Rhizoclosmatium globosum]|eukprot:ORY49060.1 FtsJ-domain-containing protein [Rhizoclosmatium globosum]
MSLFANDPRYIGTPADSPVPPPRMDPPSMFNSRGGGFGGRGGRGGGGGGGGRGDRERERDSGRGRASFGGHDTRRDPYSRDSHLRDYSSRDVERTDRRVDPQFKQLNPTQNPVNNNNTNNNYSSSNHHSNAQSNVNALPPMPVDWLSNTSNSKTLQIDAQLRKAAAPNADLFCYSALVASLGSKRANLAAADPHRLTRARSNTNKFATADQLNLFLNRAAVKLANIDSLTHLLPRLLRHQQPVFADLAAGPGGFSEYILWRARKVQKSPLPRGFGITLKGPLDFDKSFLQNSYPDFTPTYGPDNSGDLTRVEILDSFISFVSQNSPSHKVHLVTADGAMASTGDELNQEDHLKSILLAEITTALQILAPGGDFLVKTFDLLTPFSVGLLHLLYTSFARIAIIKPVSSRPANSERYIVCQDFCHPPSPESIQSLREALATLHGLRRPPTATTAPTPSSHTLPPPGFISLEERISLGLFDVYSVVDLDEVLKDSAFTDWIKESNVKLAMRQMDALGKMETYLNGQDRNNVEVPEYVQRDVARQCWREWGLSD